jgi:hypothetical protein
MLFNGLSQNLVISTSNIKLPTTTTPFTMECWVYPTAQLNGSGILSNSFSANTTVPFALLGGSGLGSPSGSNLCFGFYNFGWYGIASSTSLTLNTWSHIACSYNGTTATLYLNGTSIGTYTGEWNATSNNTSSFYVGRRHDSSATNPFFTGNITNARLIIGQSLYSSNFTRPSAPCSTYDNYGGALYFLFRALTSGTAFNDASSSGYTVNQTGSPTWSSLTPFTDSTAAPTKNDDVYFDSYSNSSGYSLTIGNGATCYSLRLYSPSSGTLSISDTSYTIDIYGALITGSSGIASLQTNGFYLRSDSTNGYGFTLNTGNNTAFASVPLRINTYGKMPLSEIRLTSDLTIGNITIDNGQLANPSYTINCKNFTVNSGSTPASELITKTEGTDYPTGSIVYIPGTGIVVYTSIYNGYFGTFYILQTQTTGSSISISGPSTRTVVLSSGFGYSPVVGGFVATVQSAPTGWPTGSNSNITAFSLTTTLSVVGGYNGGYGTLNVNGNYTVANQNDQRAVAVSNSNVTAWGPTNYTSQIQSITIKTSTQYGGSYGVDIVFTFLNGQNAFDFSQLVNSNSGGTSTVKISGRLQNSTIGSRLFNTNNAGTWLDFSLPAGSINVLMQDTLTPNTYYASVQWFGSSINQGLSLSNTGSTGYTMTASGAGYSTINLTNATSKFSSGLVLGSNVTYPGITFKSTTPYAATFYSNAGKEIADGTTVDNLVIEGPPTTGHTLVCIPGNIFVNKTFTVNSNSAGPLTRVAVFYDKANVSNWIPTDTQAKIAFNESNSTTATLKDTDFRNIKFTGGTPSQMSNTRIGDLGGNSNIGVTAPTTWYWTNGTFGGSLTNQTSNWALTTGGVNVTDGYPLPQDTIKITDTLLTSGATLTIGAIDAILPTLDFTLRSLPITFDTSSKDVFIAGDVNIPLGPTTINASSGFFYMIGGRTQTITSTNRTWNKCLAISAPTANVVLADNFTSDVTYSFAFTFPSIALLKGTLDIGNKTVTTRQFSTRYPYNSAKKTLACVTGSRINLTGTNSNVWDNGDGGWNVSGDTPNVYVTGLNSSGQINNFGPNFSSNVSASGTWAPINLTLGTGVSGSLTLVGVFNDVDLATNANTCVLSANYNPVFYGNVILKDNTNFSGSIVFHPTTGTTKTLTTNWVTGQGAVGTNGLSQDSSLYIGDSNIPNQAGTLLLQGTIKNNSAPGYLWIVNGTLDLNSNSITVGGFLAQSSSAYSRGISMNNATINAVGTSPISYTQLISFTYNSNSKFVVNQGTGAQTVTIGSGLTFPSLVINTTQQVSISTGANVTLESLTATGGQTLIFTANTTINLKTVSLVGTRTTPVNIRSTSTNTKATISKNGGALIATGVSLTDIAATGTAEFLAYESPSATRTTGWTVKVSKRPPSGFLSFC